MLGSNNRYVKSVLSIDRHQKNKKAPYSLKNRALLQVISLIKRLADGL